MGEFIDEHQKKKGAIFGGLEHNPAADRKKIATQILPALRGAMSSNRRVIAHHTDDPRRLTFAGSRWSQRVGELSGPVVPITFCAPGFARCSSQWDPAKED